MGTTVNYKWTLPTVHSDASTWGAELNTTIGAIDSVVWNIEKVELAGLQNQLSSDQLNLYSSPPTYPAAITLLNGNATAGQQVRWSIYSDQNPDGVGNTGANFGIAAYDNTGAYLSTPLTIQRSTGIVALGKSPVGPNDAATKGYVDGLAPPVGSIVMWPSSTPPANWTWCTGAAISRTTFAKLFALIGVSFGAGDGSTTFNVPNMGSRSPFAFDGSANIGTVGGEANHTLVTAEMPVHTHTDAGHTHGVTDPQHLHLMGGGYGGGIGGVSPPHPLNDGTANTYTGPSGTGITINAGAANIQNAGGGASHNNMHPYFVIGFIIRCI